MNTAETLNIVRTWPVEEQLDLVFRLWDQITDSGGNPPQAPNSSTNYDDAWQSTKQTHHGC